MNWWLVDGDDWEQSLDDLDDLDMKTAYFHGRHILNVHKERDWIVPFFQQINIPTSWIKLVWPARGPNKSSSSQHQSTGDTPGLRWLCLKMYPKAWWLMPWLGYTPFSDTPRCFAQLWIPGQWRKGSESNVFNWSTSESSTSDGLWTQVCSCYWRPPLDPFVNIKSQVCPTNIYK